MHEYRNTPEHKQRPVPLRVLYPDEPGDPDPGWVDERGRQTHTVCHADFNDQPARGRRLAALPLVMSPAPTAEMLADDDTLSFPLLTGGDGCIGGLAIIDRRGLCRELTVVLEAEPAFYPLADDEYAALSELARKRYELGDVLFRDGEGFLRDVLSYPPGRDAAYELMRLRYTAFSPAYDGTFSVVAADYQRGFAGWFVLREDFVVCDSVGVPPGRHGLCMDDELSSHFLDRRFRCGDPAVSELASASFDDDEWA